MTDKRVVYTKEPADFTEAENIIIDYPLSAEEEKELIPVVEMLLEAGQEIPGSSQELLEIINQGAGLNIAKIYDNGGRTIDRYTVIFNDGSAWGASENPGHPQGFGQFTEAIPGQHLGDVITFGDLPAAVKACLYEWADWGLLNENN